MDRKRKHVVARWLLGVLIFTSLMPQPVGATSPEPETTKQGATYVSLLQQPAAAVDVAWPMAGANPQRTSWTASKHFRGSIFRLVSHHYPLYSA